MPPVKKKGPPPRKKSVKNQRKKWSRGNIINYILSAFVAGSMVLGGLFVFGGSSTSRAVVTPVPTTIGATATTIPAVLAPNTTGTPVVTVAPVTPAAIGTP